MENDQEAQSLRPIRARVDDAIRFWEPRRLFYNGALTVLALGWLIATWPHFRPAFTWFHLFQLSVLAVLANLCYSAAYLVDIPMQLSSFSALWKARRWGLWWFGTLFALFFEYYWIADEIYPYVQS